MPASSASCPTSSGCAYLAWMRRKDLPIRPNWPRSDNASRIALPCGPVSTRKYSSRNRPGPSTAASSGRVKASMKRSTDARIASSIGVDNML
ncbi:hypothetical protein D3C72_1861800 [compost metagenome]